MRAHSARRSALGIGLGVLLGFTFAAPAQTIAITGGTVLPVSGPKIKNGTVIIKNGKITAVGGPETVVPADAKKIDAAGKWVTPGFVNASTATGLVDVGFSADANESRAEGKDNVAASFQPWLAYNPANVLIPAGREFGITSAIIWPGGGLIAGQGAVVDLAGTSLAEALVRPAVGMAGDFESDGNAGVRARAELFAKLGELIEDTRAYMTNKAAYDAARFRALPFRQIDLEAMIPVVSGKMPLVLSVDQANDIVAALAFAKEHKLRVVIYGGSEAWMVADKLAAAKTTVMVGAMNNIPRDFTSLGSRQDNAALLRKAGVNVILIGNAGGGDEDNFNIKNIRFEAGNAVGYGMKWDDALRAVTLGPAELFGVADKIGALKVGNEGNVVVWDGDPFEFATRAEHVIIRGMEYDTKSRKDLLTERYKTLPADYLKP